jgi:hypothetical protein
MTVVTVAKWSQMWVALICRTLGKGSKPERKPGLHREVSRRSTRKNKTYFLSCRDTAKGVPGLRHQQAYNINLALVEFDDAIEIVRLGENREGRKATEFRYLLLQAEKTRHVA